MNYPIMIISALCISTVSAAVTASVPPASEKEVIIRVISSMATRQVLSELIEQFEKQSEYQVVLESTGGVDAAKRVAAGETFDVVILASGAIDKLIDSEKLIPGSRTDLVKSGVAIAIKTGAEAINVSSENAVKTAVLGAKTIGYSTGPSGDHLVRLFEHWGIADQISNRIVKAPPGVPVGSLVAKGEVALGFQQLSELLHIKGITIAGPLPPEIQVITRFSAGITLTTEHPQKVKALLDFLSAPEANEIKIRNGMEPI